MPRPKRYSFAPANVDTNGIAAAITGVGPWNEVGAGELASNGPADGLAHQLNLTSAAALSGITITIVGTDADDLPITEAIAGPASNTIETTGYFKTVTSISAGATLGANTMDVGWVDEFVTASFPLRWQEGDAPAHFYYDETGTASIDIQFTNSDLSDRVSYANQAARPWFIASSSLDDETADIYAEVSSGLTGWRLVANSYTDTAVLVVNVSQADSNQTFN